jgi:hypothetical protein
MLTSSASKTRSIGDPESG